MHAAPHDRITTVKDSNGNNLTNNKDCLRRWKEHFESLLNRPTQSIDPDILTVTPHMTPPLAALIVSHVMK